MPCDKAYKLGENCMRLLRPIVSVLASLMLCNLAVAGDPAPIRVAFNIPQQPLSDALAEWSRQSGLQVLQRESDTSAPEVISAKVRGEYSPAEALARMLVKTGLKYEFVNERTVRVSAAEATKANATTGGNERPLVGERAQSESPRTGEQSGRSEAGGSQGAGSEGPEKLQEIIVTAQKKLESLHDVPVPVSVVNTEALTQSNEVRLQDYYNTVPGLNMWLGGAQAAPMLSIRGIGNGGGAPVVGIVIDDVSYGSTTNLGGSHAQPSIDPGDLARVEVLRGPQGTLYGASSMGGLLKFVTIDPSTDALSGRIQAGTSSIFNGTGDGYNFRGSVNVPVNETIAFRASAFREQDSGYIDNIQTNQKGINLRTSDGGRLSVLWKPSEVLSLKVAALVQHSTRSGPDAATVGPEFADLQIRSSLNTYTHDATTQAYSATLNAKFGDVDLTSLTGYNIDRFKFVLGTPDAAGGSFFSSFADSFFGTPGHSSVVLDNVGTRRFSQELRMSAPIGNRITWLLGGFYTDENDDDPINYNGADGITSAPATPALLFNGTKDKYREFAGFTNITYDVTDRLDVQLGGRVGEIRQTFKFLNYGPLAPLLFCPASNPSCDLAVPDRHSKESPFTYLVTPRYKVSPDLMIYARLASGYRPGGANIQGVEGIPSGYSSEKTENYEFGLKGDFLDHVVSFEASVYYIDWKNIQTGLTLTNSAGSSYGYNENLGHAKSQGVELSAEARPIRGLTISAWVAWDQAEFLGNLPISAGAARPNAGDPLPYSSRFSGSLSADEEFLVRGPLTAFVGGSVRYVGDRLGTLQAPPVPRANLPAYAQTDVHAGLKYESWAVTAFVNNVTDKRGVLAGAADYQYLYPDPNTYTFIQPRTVGLNAIKSF
jgi:iron complex outermembrane receptor protein